MGWRRCVEISTNGEAQLNFEPNQDGKDGKDGK